MNKTVSSVGELEESYTLKDIKVERLGYLTLLSFGMDGARFRFEFLDRGQDAVFVLPVDWKRRVLFLVKQPRPIKSVSCDAGRKVLKAVVANPGLSLSLNVPGTAIHTLDAPAGMIDGDETPEAAGVREVLEETGFVIDAADLELVSSHFTSTGCSTERHIAYIVNVSESQKVEKPEGDGSERIETLEVTFEEAFMMLDQCKVEHATLASLLREVLIREMKRVEKLQATQIRELREELDRERRHGGMTSQ